MIGNDLTAAWRRLRARPGHAAVAIGILSLGLAATLFLFGALNGLVLRPLPFPQAERLVSIGWQEGAPGSGLDPVDAAHWAQLREGLPGIEAVALDGGPATVNLGEGDRHVRYNGAAIDAALLPLLGVQPILGRGFDADDDRPGAPLRVLLGERVWRRDFRADPAIVGRPLRANGEAATVIGVLPARFGWPSGQEVWIARRYDPADGLALNVVARLAPGTAMATLAPALSAHGLRLAPLLGLDPDEAVLAAEPLAWRFVGQVTRQMVWMMFAAGLLVLLLVCANVANLQLGQVLARRRELAVRSALGAGRARLLRELLAEAALISLAATAIAVLLAHYGGQWVLSVMLANEFLPSAHVDFGYDGRDVVFIAGIALASCLFAGLVPGLRAAGTDVQDALRDGSRGSHGGAFIRISRGLVVVEIALTVVLLVGAAMFIRGIQGMLEFDHGGDTDPATVMTARVGLFAAQHPEPESRQRVFDQIVARLQAQPQVLAASVGTGIPGSAGQGSDNVAVPGQPVPARGHHRADHAWVDAGFAQVYGLRLREGRFFDARDRAGSEPVTVIGRTLAKQLFGERPALGQRLLLDPEDPQPYAMTVVGVVDDLHLRSLELASRPALLRPIAQSPPFFATVAVRLRGDAAGFGPSLAQAVRSVDPEVAVYWLRSHAQAVRMGRVGAELLTRIFAGVGVLALLLAAVGLYGVLAFSVAQRTREIGIRRAIGAGVPGVIGLVVRRTGWQVLAGLAIGLALAVPWALALANPVLTAGGPQPLLFVAVAAVVVLVAAIASLAPLRRALRVDPIIALRHD
jgi:predicted permease